MFRDRREAGRLLGRALLQLGRRSPLVLALPRGGVPVGFEVARALRAPLDVVVVRKIGAPFHRELGVGALVLLDKPEIVWNHPLLEDLGLSETQMRDEVAAQESEAQRRLERYGGNRAPLQLKGRAVILVDDGLATGITARAALQALRRARPGYLVLAVPVAPPDTFARLSEEADESVCLCQPPFFQAVGQFYKDFSQTTDEDVVALLSEARTQLSNLNPNLNLGSA